MSQPSRLFVLDRSLSDLRGHHLRLTNLMTQSAQHAGAEVSWLAAKGVDPAHAPEGVTVEPWFGATMYDAFKDSFSEPSPTERIQKSVMARLRQALGRPEPPQQQRDTTQDFVRDLERAIETYCDGSPVRFFIHTGDGDTFRALGALAYKIAEAPGLKLHLCTPYDPTGVIPHKNTTGSAERGVETARAAGLIGVKVFLHAENPILAEHLSSLFKVPVSTLEIPVEEFSADIHARAAVIRNQLGVDDDTTIVGSLGPARVEKGFHLIPEVLRSCKASIDRGDTPGLSRDRIHFALHAAPQIIGRDPKIQTALDEIARDHSDMATLFPKPLDTLDYDALLAASDIVLMPYDRELYRVRGSGVVVEAISAGKVIVASEGSYPARRIADGAGAVARAPDAFADAICAIAHNKTSYLTAAAAARDGYNKTTSVNGYFQNLLAAERATGPTADGD